MLSREEIDNLLNAANGDLSASYMAVVGHTALPQIYALQAIGGSLLAIAQMMLYKLSREDIEITMVNSGGFQDE